MPVVGMSNNDNTVIEKKVISLEPEEIVTHRDQNGSRMYLIKWKNIPTEFNVWLPPEKLVDNPDMLLEYFSKCPEATYFPLSIYDRVKCLYNSLKIATEEEINSIVKRHLTTGGLVFPLSKIGEIRKTLSAFVRDNPYYISDLDDSMINELESVRFDILVEEILEKRKAQLIQLKKREIEINMISNNKSLITVENLVDLEIIPSNFKYINHCLPGPGVSIPEDPPIGCDCTQSGGCVADKCCPQSSGSFAAYDIVKHRVVAPVGTAIYECNSRCKCDKYCVNRVVQNGSNVKLCIFRTFNGCGWGVKAMDNIPKGTFVAEYVGEIIGCDEAQKRSEDDYTRRYLFDLDFNPKSHSELHCMYTVDASLRGNISHFINHSCDPNLTVYSVYVNCLDPDLHRVCLFAVRSIKYGEELTFNYMYLPGEHHKRTDTVCKCGSQMCLRHYT